MKKQLVFSLILFMIIGVMVSTSHYNSDVIEAADGSLTTTYANNSGLGNANSGLMFDVTALSQDIQIDYFETHSDESVTTNVTVYYKAGSHLGFEKNSAAWTLLGTTSVTFAGTGAIVQVDVGPLLIPSGQTYGIYMLTNASDATIYTIGGNVYSNSDIQITTGTALSRAWGAFNTYYPRTWNGTIYYSFPVVTEVYQPSDDYSKIGQIRVSTPGIALYEDAGGNVLRDDHGAEIWVPNQTADDPSQDTYDVLAQTTIDDVTWVEIFVGDANYPVWVPVGGPVQIISLVE